MKPDGTIGTLNGWHNIETQLKYAPYQNAEHEFIVAVAGNVEWGHTGDVGIGFADPFTSLTAKGFVGKGFGDVEAEWLRPIAVTGEIDYTWSTHPIDVTGVDQFGNVLISQTPTVLTYGATLQYSLLYMNSFVHEVPEFFRQLIPDIECVFSTPVSNIGPSTLRAVPGTHETTGTWGPGLYYFGRLGPCFVSTRRRGANSDQSRERQTCRRDGHPGFLPRRHVPGFARQAALRAAPGPRFDALLRRPPCNVS